MPNWVHQTVKIQGNKQTLEQVRDFLFGEEFQPFDFMKVIAPADREKYEESLTKTGVSPYWYDWNNEHWGTKWNAVECSTDGIHTTVGDDGFIVYHFDTAWSPPEQIMERLVEICRALGLRLYWYYEEEQGWGGEWTLEPTSGEVLIKTWDIPLSHADYTELDKECVCSWSDDPEDRFSDCP